MKIDFYFDWYPGMDLKFATSMAQPSTLGVGGAMKRYKFTVEIADPHSPTEPVQEVTATEVTS